MYLSLDKCRSTQPINVNCFLIREDPWSVPVPLRVQAKRDTRIALMCDLRNQRWRASWGYLSKTPERHTSTRLSIERRLPSSIKLCYIGAIDSTWQTWYFVWWWERRLMCLLFLFEWNSALFGMKWAMTFLWIRLRFLMFPCLMLYCRISK